MEITTIIEKFKSLYGTQPIIARAPGRVNLIGEHTDYNDGFVLPAAVDKEIVFAMQSNGTTSVRVFSIDMQESKEFALSQLVPQQGWINYIIGVFAELAKRDVKVAGTDLVFAGDVPLGAGMSSSAALESALATGLNYLYNGGLSKLELALAAQAAEHNFAGVKCGLMDQYASIFGKTNHVIKLDCRTQLHEYYNFDFSEFMLVLCDTNVKHSLASSEYNIRRAQCESGVEIVRKKYSQVKNLRDVTLDMLNEVKKDMDPVIFNRCEYVIEENDRVEKACKALTSNDFATFGQLMYQSHEGLQHKYEVSCPELDYLVELARKNPHVLGARMMGGGFGGCTINLIHRNAVDDFVEKTATAYHQKTGLEMKAYRVKIGDGARIEKI
ncbi:MAG TPA: galactokinase [Bacteroidales bacterium]|nr:galactokinase [Bacteroidales bacterium]